MFHLQVYTVNPRIPESLQFLDTLARNMWWCWETDAVDLFRCINPQLWRDSGYNPLRFLSMVPQDRLETLAEDNGYQAQMDGVRQRFDSETAAGVSPVDQDPERRCIAYFSLEFGIHSSLPIYSGGLGVLAGDHLKASSDHAIPLVGVGIIYRQGYFQQFLNQDAWQQERYPENALHHLPLAPACVDGAQAKVSVNLPGGPVQAAIWRLDVGRTPLYLLDANIPENPPEKRAITGQLYGGDRHMRLQQEILLGIGGYRALRMLGYLPEATHINEGHAAFLNLARLHDVRTRLDLSIDEAIEVVRRSNVFTTHTPVPAGNEAFHVDMLRPYLDALAGELDLDPNLVLSWGKPDSNQDHHELSNTVLGLRMAEYANGVSKLHGQVARTMWSHLWPDYQENEIPIGHITNGVHVPTWLSTEHSYLYNRYIGREWRRDPRAILDRVDRIPDEELWHAHEATRERLLRNARDYAVRQMKNRNATNTEIQQARTLLDHDTLTIGFARRFATYKRATLLLRDPDRFEALLTNPDRPVQFIFAGKAHPADNQGKELIRQLVHFARRSSVRRHVVFLENYDMHMARRMVQGVDVWLNTPRRPMEASGTSGMKACINGGLHCSVLDGWWTEGYDRSHGWTIGNGEHYNDPEYADATEAQALYNLLENEIVPTFYERNDADIPVKWIARMKASIKMSLGQFSCYRMVGEYYDNYYKPAQEAYRKLADDKGAEARRLVQVHQRLASCWGAASVEAPQTDREIAQLRVGDTFEISTLVHLGDLKPEDVDVEVYYGTVDSKNELIESRVAIMEMDSDKGNGAWLYKQKLTCESTGRYGFTTRVTPTGSVWHGKMPGFVHWA